MKYSNLIYLSVFLFVFLSACEQTLEQPNPFFRIEKDTIIDNVKTRIELDMAKAVYADTINPVYFVYEGASKFNSVWPGDIVVKQSLKVRTPEGEVREIDHSIIQDYDAREDSLILRYSPRDSLYSQYKVVYQGISLPYGSNEIEYTYQRSFDEPVTVTWVSTETDVENSKTEILQKEILVK